MPNVLSTFGLVLVICHEITVARRKITSARRKTTVVFARLLVLDASLDDSALIVVANFADMAVFLTMKI